MRVRCPYCRGEFEPAGRSRCTLCGRSVLMPGFFSRPGGSSPAYPWIPPEQGPRSGGGAGEWLKPLRLVLLAAGLLLLAQVLVRSVSARRIPQAEETFVGQAIENLGILRLALEQLARDCGRYPTEDEGLAALVLDPRMDGWKGPYVFEIKPDPWGNPFVYGRSDAAAWIRSNGPDRRGKTHDDIMVLCRDGMAGGREEEAFSVLLAPPDHAEDTR